MINVLVVDDEPIVRLAMKSLADWKSHGIYLEYEASNGRQALDIMMSNKIDVVITDINMPVMDGLELISAIRREGLTQNIIVLSAYDDYNLVRQAFRLGAKDYILKNEMNPENVLKLINEMVNTQAAGESEEDEVGIKSLKEHVIKNLLSGNMDNDFKEELGRSCIRLGKRNIACCFLWVDDYSVVVERYDSSTLGIFVNSVCDAVGQVLADRENGEVISLSPQEYVVVLHFDSMSISAAADKMVEILGSIRHHLASYINISVSIGVSSIKSGFGNVSKLFTEAEKNARMRFIFGKGRTIFPQDTLKLEGERAGSIIGRENGFIMALKEGNRNRIFHELSIITDEISRFKFDKIERMYAYYMELIFVIMKFLSDMGVYSSDIFGKEVDFYQSITRFETCDEINNWLKNMVGWIADYLNGKKDWNLNRAITRACLFIKNNYNNGITLKMVSDYVELNESHFSYVFAKSTGMTFTDYLTKVRIEKAKELIVGTNLKIYEIAEQVGYTSTEHFSRVFKKNTGQSPSSCKRQ